MPRQAEVLGGIGDSKGNRWAAICGSEWGLAGSTLRHFGRGNHLVEGSFVVIVRGDRIAVHRARLVPGFAIPSDPGMRLSRLRN